MKPPDWVTDAAFYQIFPDRFFRSGRPAAHPRPADPYEPWDGPPTVRGFKGGDLWGVAEKLDYLVELGVNAIYLNPVFASSANHRYHTSDYFRVDPILGGDEALRHLLDAAHARGLRVILDGVFNHTGRGFFAFQHLLENGPASPYRDWYHVKGFPLHAYGGRPNYAAWWDNPELPKLRTETPAVRDYLLDVAEYWIRFGADGWRLDVPEEIADMEFWSAFRRRVKEANPEAYLVGEIWHEAPDWVAPAGPFDGVMNYPLGRAVLGFVGGEAFDRDLAARSGLGAVPALDAAGWAERVAAVLGRYPAEANRLQLNLLTSHDTPRLFTMMRDDAGRAALALELLVVLPGAPNLYYGDEIGLPGVHDPDNRRAFPWAHPERWNHGLRERVRAILNLRREHEDLRAAGFDAWWAEGRRVAFVRGRYRVAVNADARAWTLDLPCPAPHARFRGLLHDGRLDCRGGRLRGAELPPWTLEVWAPRD